ncbi:hypothetical protein SAMN02990966_04229 [Rhodospirillales bacterium URHD0017]|nr:hypothetical protein SAMN02990966_04229 [Rhodospirillales bacterium URHD0017]
MNDPVHPSRDDERARHYSAQIHQLNDEPMQDDRKSTWRRRAVAGVVLGSMAYLMTGCFLEYRLDKPKMDRANLRFGHTPHGN